MTEKRKKDKIIGWAISVGIHSAMLLLFFFLLAWKRPNPPAPEYGVELNFGLVESGAPLKQINHKRHNETLWKRPTQTEIQKNTKT
jgi:protein TonB